jgi:hypothetical protein
MWCDGVRTAVDAPVSRAGWRRCCALAPPPRRHAARWLRLRNVGSATISACLFKVYRNESDAFEQFGDDDRFDIIEGGVLKIHRQDGSNCQHLWIKIFYAASSVVVSSSGRSTSLPFSNRAPARTSATRWGALIARQRDWAASISL